MKKGNSTIGVLNLFLIAFSLFIAFLFPITTFVLAYAILGPLHYLTQLNWLHTKDFFKENRRLKYSFVLLAVIATIFFLLESYTNAKISWYLGRNVYSVLVVTGVIITVFSLSKTDNKTKIGLILLGIVSTIMFSSNLHYLILFGILFVSVIHVYLFTLLHMINGYMRNRSLVDLINSFIMILVPLAIFLSPWVNSFIKTELITPNRFITGLTLNLSYLIGFSQFETNSVIVFKLSWFIAFAYLYHYLNWFSKTKIIHWHDGLTKKKTILICGISLLFSAVYLLGFEYGLVASLFLSYLHVFAELPLNYLSVKNIVKGITKK